MNIAVIGFRGIPEVQGGVESTVKNYIHALPETIGV